MTIITDRKKGFTLAEVLITLTIIGVVAALTIPGLLANVSDKTYDAKRKGLATRMAQAISQIDVINAYEAKMPEGYSGSETEKEYAEYYSSVNFVVEALNKAYKIKNVCEFDKFTACDFPPEFGRYSYPYHFSTRSYRKLSNINGNATETALGGINPDAAVIKTANGESILLWYNPRCTAEQAVNEETQSKNYLKEICLNMWYDLDGSKKGPNVFGRDMGMMIVLYSDAPYLVVPYPVVTSLDISAPSYSDDSELNATTEAACANNGGVGYNAGSFTQISREELYAWSLSYCIYSSDKYSWTGTIEGSEATDYGWQVQPRLFIAKRALRTQSANAYCILNN